jgi:hypothetical protein
MVRAWQVEGELVGHRPSRTIAFASALQDLADERAGVRVFPVTVPTRPSWWRRLFGR